MNDRVIPLEGIHNFRDYGSYSARDGARLRNGLLWRSGQHLEATKADLDRVAALDIATVIDLRGDSERSDFPCARHADFNARILFAAGETVDGNHAPHLEAAMDVRTAQDAHVAMARLYATMPFRPNLVAIYRLYFDALANRDGASLLHCLAGKDRTGIAAALLHSLMGVHHDDLMADYLLTNVAGDVERRIAAGAQVVRANFGPDMDDAAVRTLMSVHPDFLDTAFTAITERHGSVDAYARDVLGVTPGMVAQMEERLLV